MAIVPERWRRASQTACGIPIQIETSQYSGRVSVDVLLVYNLGERNNGKKIVGRAPGDPGKAEAWGFPAGGVEKGETPRMAMVRECRDESGYAVRDIIYEQDEPIVKADVWPNGNVIHFFLLELDDLQGRIKETDEIDAVERTPRWMSVEEVFALPVQDDGRPVAGGIYYSHRQALENVLLGIAEASDEDVANWPDPNFRSWLLKYGPAIQTKVAELIEGGFIAKEPAQGVRAS